MISLQGSFLCFNCSFSGSFLSYSVDSRNAGPVLEKLGVVDFLKFRKEAKILIKGMCITARIVVRG
jgi:hypothetical protein